MLDRLPSERSIANFFIAIVLVAIVYGVSNAATLDFSSYTWFTFFVLCFLILSQIKKDSINNTKLKEITAKKTKQFFVVVLFAFIFLIGVVVSIEMFIVHLYLEIKITLPIVITAYIVTAFIAVISITSLAIIHGEEKPREEP